MSLAVIDAGIVQYSIGLALHTDDYHTDGVQAARIRYNNHLGAVDNLTQTGVGGNGTATADDANHEMDLVSGTLAASGNARFETKTTYTLSAKAVIANFIITNIAPGTAGNRFANTGLSDDFSNSVPNNCAGFHFDGANFYIKTANAGTTTTQNITTPSSGDKLTIIATSTAVAFYVNGGRVGILTTNLPAAAMKIGGSVHSSVATSASVTISIDYMGFIQKL